MSLRNEIDLIVQRETKRRVVLNQFELKNMQKWNDQNL